MGDEDLAPVPSAHWEITFVPLHLPKECVQTTEFVHLAQVVSWKQR